MDKNINSSLIKYKISFSEPHAHYVDIKLFIKNFELDFVDLKMPTWTPGSYLIREFSKNLESFQAKDKSGNLISYEKKNKNTWRVFTNRQDVEVSYQLYGFETSVRTNFIDDSHAFLSSAATFLYVDQQLELPVIVKIDLPPFWNEISTGLQTTENKNEFYAENFDILYDSPIEIGNQDRWYFEAAGVQHEFAMVGQGNYNREQLTDDISKIIEEETKIWGTNPNDFYLFITHNYQNGSGGLEHLNSTVLGASRNGYNQSYTYNNFLSLVAHEYFHLWHVKRLRPLPLGPFDYENENYTSLLWIFEGFTAYYDNLITRRCGFRDEKDYLQNLALEFNIVYNRPGYKYQSVGLASFDSWIKQYRPDENSPNVSISYYNKGAMLASAIDIKIIAETNGEMRLDDVLKAAYAKFYLTEQRGFEEKEFQALAEEVTGVSLAEIFEAVYKTEELDYNLYFNRVGYEIVDLNAGNQHLSFGIKTVNNDFRIIIKGVDRDSGAWKAGLNVNDEIIAVNGLRVDPSGRELDNILLESSVGDIVDFMVSRDGVIRTIPTEVMQSPKKSLTIERLLDATDEQRSLGDIWLSL